NGGLSNADAVLVSGVTLTHPGPDPITTGQAYDQREYQSGQDHAERGEVNITFLVPVKQRQPNEQKAAIAENAMPPDVAPAITFYTSPTLASVV
ncbi:MAG: hypothetical protein WA671_14695, partial [Candidatus Sulfotelmatobacter sp.]